ALSVTSHQSPVTSSSVISHQSPVTSYSIAEFLNIAIQLADILHQLHQNRYALIMEDFGGIALSVTSHQRCSELAEESPVTSYQSPVTRQCLSRNLSPALRSTAPKGYQSTGNNYQLPVTHYSIAEFLNIAIQLAEILHQLHQNQIIHKDIKPANILIHPDTQQVKLIDFSISSLLPKETQTLQTPNVLEGTLKYLSPEQTGRMNRGIDYRSDFYSLGVTFYELLTGKLPFDSEDPLELIHAHIAKMAAPLGNRGEIPEVLSNIVMKLMAKNAEDRYQNGLGLKYDLAKCLLQWQATGDIPPFTLGERDLCDRFLIPEKLYGREKEVQTLLDTFLRVANPPRGEASQTEMMLVAGFSGIGKTAIVNEVHKPIVKQRGYFIKGKFDQFNRNIPFSAFVQAFRDLMGQLLGESDARLADWNTKILAALGDNGRVIIEVIPELEQIIGQQPPVPELSGTAAQNRFHLLLQQFIAVFTAPEHPLVIFLDDLQWADSASLNLMKVLLGDRDRGYLLLLGAYRDNEVSPAHPLMVSLKELEKDRAIMATITLKPLAPHHIDCLVADALGCGEKLARPLSELVYQKTRGNPFFTTQFLKGLYEEHLIVLNPDSGYWECDLVRVRKAALTDDVVEFMAGRLQKLPEATREVLKLSACIGNRFDLATLAIVCDRPEEEVAGEMWAALKEGLILPASESYKFFQEWSPADRDLAIASVGYRFLHDRVQQAAYSLIPRDRQQRIHFKIGKKLQSHYQDHLEDVLFEIVNHLNLGADFLETDSEREELARLNALAVEKALTSTAYKAAIAYFQQGSELLPGDRWESQYAMTLKLHELAAQAYYLCGDYPQMNGLAREVLDRAASLLDRISLYEIQIQAYISQNEQQCALNLGLEVLELLDIALIQERPQHEENIEALIEYPVLEDPKIVAALRILTNIITPAWTLSPQYFKETILTMVNLSLEFGMCPNSAFGFAWYATWLCESEGDIDSGYRFGKLAMNLVDRFAARALRSSVCVLFATHVGHWQEHVRQCLPVHIQGLQSGLETGNLEYACYGAAEYGQYLFLTGKPLLEVEPECRQKLHVIQGLKQDFHIQYLAPWHQGILNLQSEESREIEKLIGESYDETTFMEKVVRENQLTLGFSIFFVKMFLAYLFDRPAKAADFGESACRYTAGVFGTYFVPTTLFYHALSLLARDRQDPSSKRQEDLERVDGVIEKLKNWARFAPMNHQHKHDLLAAERARTRGDNLAAMDYYDRAITGAKAGGYLQEESLANELAGKFYLAWGKETIAEAYLQKAYYGYAHWGAKAKVKDLERTYPQYFTVVLHRDRVAPTAEVTIPRTTRGSHSASIPAISSLLDVSTLLEASQILSREIELEKLLSKVINVAVTHAGATKGALLLVGETALTIEAIATYAQEEKTLNLTSVGCSIPLERSQELPIGLIRYVRRTTETVLLDAKAARVQFPADLYWLQHSPLSLLCLPLLERGKTIGILYLENTLTADAFTRDRVELLDALCAQAAITLENARLYQQAQQALQLEKELHEMQRTQLKLIQSEKMYSLGQMVAGIAHEINNPISFIHGNIAHAHKYTKDLMRLLELYQYHCPQAHPEICEEMEEMDLEFLKTDLHDLLQSMRVGTHRIKNIVTSLRTFSRLDESDLKVVDLHEGIESTLTILHARLQAREERAEIQIVKDYGNLPLVKCYAGQLNQVFVNILNNAMDALEDSETIQPQIGIRTRAEGERVAIAISDNGMGMNEETRDRIFDPFFTTKAVGKGTGLGLSISYQIITEQHQGTIFCQSELGQGTELVISLPLH
ncbi:MAG: AAA family ATPase, partial [Spirulina sp.]